MNANSINASNRAAAVPSAVESLASRGNPSGRISENSRQQKNVETEQQARAIDARNAAKQTEQQRVHEQKQLESAKPTVNANGQPIGQRINTTA